MMVKKGRLTNDYHASDPSSIAKARDANFPDEAEYRAELRAAGFQK